MAGFEGEDTKPVQCSLRAGIGDRSLLPIPPNDEFGIGYFVGDPGFAASNTAIVVRFRTNIPF